MAEDAGQARFYGVISNWLRRTGLIFRRAFITLYENNCFGLAKGVAYSALLAFFPFLTTLTAILVQANAPSVSRMLSSLVFEVVPPGTEEIVLYNFTERGQRPASLLIVATVLTLWAASGVMASLMQGFQAAYRIERGRPFLKQRLTAILLVIFVAIPIVTASALIVFGARTERMVFTSLGMLEAEQQLHGWVSFLGQLLRYGVALGAIVFSTALLYYIGPNRPNKLRRVLPGALVATVLWWMATTIFGWYVRNIANYNVLYGSIGAVVALLVWMYILSVIALYGCEFNAQRERTIHYAVPH
ncbi:MAG: YihY/virulence factor BrkB family protein [Bryobacteraceae bacterium]